MQLTTAAFQFNLKQRGYNVTVKWVPGSTVVCDIPGQYNGRNYKYTVEIHIHDANWNAVSAWEKATFVAPAQKAARNFIHAILK